MGSLVRLATQLEAKKSQAGLVRRRGQRELAKAKSTLRRSSSGLSAVERGIRGAHETLVGVSESLSQNIERQNSLRRLIDTATERLAREKDAKKDADRDLAGETNEDRRQSVEWRLGSISDTIAQLESELRQRKSTLKKITVEIERASSEKSRLSTNIRKKRQARPKLARLVEAGRKRSATLSKMISSKSRQEDSASKNLKKIRSRLAELAAKKRSAAARKAVKTRRAKTPKRKTTASKKTGGASRPAARRPKAGRAKPKRAVKRTVKARRSKPKTSRAKPKRAAGRTAKTRRAKPKRAARARATSRRTRR